MANPLSILARNHGQRSLGSHRPSGNKSLTRLSATEQQQESLNIMWMVDKTTTSGKAWRLFGDPSCVNEVEEN